MGRSAAASFRPESLLKLYKSAELPRRTQLQTQPGYGGQAERRRQVGDEHTSTSAECFFKVKAILLALVGSLKVPHSVHF